ncbi:hypothetical protein MUP01_10780 [Candidatus Bathyarchaeota archaeon]|nr:hypothetical protein [Candidatus Bathyarchaeota archaeon]
MKRPGLLTIGCLLEGLDGLLFLLAALGVGVLTALVGSGSIFTGGWIGMVVATMGGGGGTFALLCGVEGLLCLAGAYGLWTGKNWGRLIVTGLGLLEILGVAYTFLSGGIDFITPIVQGIVLGYLWLSKDVKRFLK